MSDTETAPDHGTHSSSLGVSSSRPGHAVLAAIGPGDVVGRYHVRDLLGTGGMGQVFTAFDPQLGRTVALKIIRPDGLARSSRARGRARLLREAQALARLSHPNVVAIHDVGTQGDQVFIAMELVAGPTLRAWLAGTSPSWRQIRDVFVAAGRGLAAAHAAGIVHRDFKPSNVIVGSGRVVVVDFGLARALGEERGEDDDDRSDSGSSISGSGSSSSSSSVLDVNLTLTGEAVGTPRYMAPEQRAAAPASEHSDQFAFSVALWEALYGAAPVAGQPLPPAPPGAKIPERLRAALARGLSLKPADRWRRLDDLLDLLARDPWAPRRRVAAILALSIAAIVGPLAYIAGRQTPAPSCGAPVLGLWDEGPRAEVRAAFAATHKPFAADSFAIVDSALRARLAAWARAHEEACAATEIRHEQSAALMDARMACLARARGQIAAFIDVLGTADADAVAGSTSAAATVGDLEACANAGALTAALPPPRDAATAAAVAALERESAHVEALALVGKVHAATRGGAALVERARALGHPPLLARVLYGAGGNACLTGDPHAAEALLYEAARAAAAAHDDALAVTILGDLIWCVGTREMNIPSARALAEMAEVTLARAGNPPDQRVRLYRAETFLRRQAGDLLVAFAYAELELMAARQLYEDDSMQTGLALADVADGLALLGAYRGALTMYAEALPILERTLGPSHPGTAVYLANLGSTATDAGDLDGAAAALERALAIDERTYGADQAGALAISMRGLAAVRHRQGRLAAARELLLRARASEEAAGRGDHPAATETMRLLALVDIDDGQLDEALALAARARAISVAAYGAEHPDVADMDVVLADIARRRHDGGGARRLLERALAAHRKACGARHPRVASDETALGQLLLDAGQPAAALPLLEEALATHVATRDRDADEIVTAHALLAEARLALGDRAHAVEQAGLAVAVAAARPRRPELEGRARFTLALALEHTDRAQALELAREARDRTRTAPHSEAAARIDRWLLVRSSHGPHR